MMRILEVVYIAITCYICFVVGVVAYNVIRAVDLVKTKV